MSGAAQVEFGGFRFGFREGGVGMDTQGQIFGQGPHLYGQDRFRNQSHGVTADHPGSDDAPAVRIEDDLGEPLGQPHGSGASRKFPGKALDGDGNVSVFCFLFGYAAPGDLRIGVYDGGHCPYVKSQSVSGKDFSSHLALAGGFVGQHDATGDITHCQYLPVMGPLLIINDDACGLAPSPKWPPGDD